MKKVTRVLVSITCLVLLAVLTTGCADKVDKNAIRQEQVRIAEYTIQHFENIKKIEFKDLICTPFTGQTGERGIIMRYSFEFKLECIEMYERGEFPDTPDGVSTKRFRDNIRQWKRMVDSSGIDSLHHKPQNRKWKPEEKLELIVKVLAGESCTFVALSNGIQPGMLYQWVNKYKL